VFDVERVRGGVRMYSLGQAARAVGKAKSTISRDVKNGRISATRNANGSLAIDPAELHRVYPAMAMPNGSGNAISNDREPPQGVVRTPVGTAVLRREVELLREQLGECRETILDLRARLDGEVEERRKLIALLTDQRIRPWWRRWFR
jgi:hypothetical protein